MSQAAPATVAAAAAAPALIVLLVNKWGYNIYLTYSQPPK